VAFSLSRSRGPGPQVLLLKIVNFAFACSRGVHGRIWVSEWLVDCDTIHVSSHVSCEGGHICTYIYTWIYTCVYIDARVFVYIFKYVYVYIQICIWYLCVHVYVHIHMYIHTSVYVCMYACKYVYVCVLLYAWMYVYAYSYVYISSVIWMQRFVLNNVDVDTIRNMWWAAMSTSQDACDCVVAHMKY